MPTSPRRPTPSSFTRRRLLRTAGAGAGLTALLLAACGDDGERATIEPAGAGNRATPAGGQTPQPGGALRSLIDEEPATLDPIAPSGGVGAQLGAFVYSRLIRFKPGEGRFADGTLEGDLMARWEQPDPATLIMTMRDGVRLDPRPPTNGRALTTDDIVATWEQFAAKGTYRADLSNAANKDAPITSVRATEAKTIEFKLAQPDAQLLPTLASRFGLWILPREAFTGGFDPKTEMRGSGPWLLDAYTTTVGFSFKKNPNSFLGPQAPLADGVELPVIADTARAESQFRAKNIYGGPALGGAAVSPVNILAFKKDLAETRIDLGPPELIGPTIAFGYREGSPFRDARVRRAVSMLIDRDTFLDVFANLKAFQDAGVKMKGYWSTPLSAGWGPYWLDPKGSAFGPAAANFKLDVAGAKQLLAAAGYPDGFQTPFTFLSGSNWGRDWGQRAEALMAMLARGGVRCQANPVDYNTVFIPQYLRKGGDFDGMAMQRTGSRGDPGQWYGIFFASTGANSQLGRNFPEVDALVLKQRRELDPARRVALIHDLQRYFGEQMPSVPQAGHTEEPTLTWQGLHGPDRVYNWGGGDLGAEAYPSYWVDRSLRG